MMIPSQILANQTLDQNNRKGIDHLNFDQEPNLGFYGESGEYGVANNNESHQASMQELSSLKVF